MNAVDLTYYGEFGPVLEERQAFLLTEIRRILDMLTTDAEHAPAEHLRSRIKGSGSLQAKLRRQGIPGDAASGVRSLADLIGVRIVTHFVGDVYAILAELRRSECWEVVQVKDYISHPKPNGYRSLHVIVQFPIDCGGLTAMRAEIQLRTIAMDCWASLEHQLKYKKNIRNTELIVRELKRCADEMASTDLSMQTIREMIEEN